ncbi:MAG: hypothetical protein HQL38_01170, partial [Alphaproteobacteria bacterium]|nr:hypothetical protein [Alphaproteobacteria bacterium]
MLSLAAGGVLIIGGGLMMYMGSLVKSAYQIKVEIRSEMEQGIRRLEEDIDKKSKWIKRDLIEEIDKMKAAVQTDNTKRFNEFLDTINKRVAEFESGVTRDRNEILKVIENHRQTITNLDQRMRALKREQKAGEIGASRAAPADGAAPA